MHRNLLLRTMLLVLCAVLAALGVLTLLHAHLQDPAVAQFDLEMQRTVHGWGSPGLDVLMRALSWLGSIKIFGSALAGGVAVLLWQRMRHAAALLGLPMLGALVLNETLKLHFQRARPTVPWAIGDEHTFSFPSGHSLFSVVLYGTLAYLALQRPTPAWRRVALLLAAIILPLAIGLSRIYLGMHFPTDVLAGYSVGVIWLGLTVVVDRAWRAGPTTSHPFP